MRSGSSAFHCFVVSAAREGPIRARAVIIVCCETLGTSGCLCQAPYTTITYRISPQNMGGCVSQISANIVRFILLLLADNIILPLQPEDGSVSSIHANLAAQRPGFNNRSVCISNPHLTPRGSLAQRFRPRRGDLAKASVQVKASKPRTI